MASILLERPFNRLPQGHIDLNRFNPILRGLVVAYVWGNGPQVLNASAGDVETLTSNQYFSLKTTAIGSGLYRDGTNAEEGYHNITVPSLSGDITFVCLHIPETNSLANSILDDDISGVSRRLQFRTEGASLSTALIWFNGAGTAYTATATNPGTFQGYTLSVGIKKGLALTTYTNKNKGTATMTGTPLATSTTLQAFNRKTTGSKNPYKGTQFYTLIFNRALEEREVFSLVENPFQIFQPLGSRLWINAISGSSLDYTIVPSGQVSLDGTSVSTTTRVLLPQGSVTLSGNSLVTKTRILNPSGELALTGTAVMKQTRILSPTGSLTLQGSAPFYVPGMTVYSTKMPLTGVGT